MGDGGVLNAAKGVAEDGAVVIKNYVTENFFRVVL
jgi:hypothetical protein